MPAPAPQNLLADAVFIAKVRRNLRDFPTGFTEKPATDGLSGALVAGSKPFRLPRPPIYKNGALPLVTAPGGAYSGVPNSYLPVFDAPLPPAGTLAAPVIADGGAGGALPAGDYMVFWTLAGVGAAAASLPSPLSNKVTIAINRKLTVTGLPNPIPAGGINVYIGPSSALPYDPPAASWGFALFIAGGAAGPYQVVLPGSGVSPVFMNSETGEVVFGSPPKTGTLAASYQGSRFSDDQITDALYEGLNNLWPEIWNPAVNTTQIQLSPTQFEYGLQSLFADQRAIILEIEYSPPSGFIRYYRTSLWRTTEDIVNPTLIFTELPPISSIVRITYCTTFANLGATPTQVQHLPVYYACARLLADQETMRSRADDLPALTGEAANPPGTSLAAAAYWLQRFQEQLPKFAMDEPARRSVADRTVESLGLSNFWVHAA